MKRLVFGVAFSVFASNLFAATSVMEDPDFTHSALKEFSNCAEDDRDVMELIKKEVTAVKDAAIAHDQQRADEGIKKIDEFIKLLVKVETAQQ